MNGLDITITALISISVTFGLYRGLVREIFSLSAVVFGILVAAWYYPEPAIFLQQWITNKTLANSVSFIGTFITVALVIGLIGALVRRFLKHAHLDLEDRLLGGVFGFVKGLFVSTALILVLLAFMPPAHPFIAQSKMLPYFVRLAAVVKGAIPGDLRTTVDDKKRELFEIWKEQKQKSHPKEP